MNSSPHEDELDFDRRYQQKHHRSNPNPNLQNNIMNVSTIHTRPLNSNEKSYGDGRSGIYNLNTDTLYPGESPPGPTRRPRRTSSHEEEIYSKIAFKRPPKNSEARVEPVLIALEVVIIVLFALFVSYDDQASAVPKPRRDTDNRNGNNYPSNNNFDNRFGNVNGRGPAQQSGSNEYSNNNNIRTETSRMDVPEQNLHQFYYFYQDVQVMVFVGFGFLMNFLRKYGYSAIGLTLIVGAVAIQWSILCRGLFHHGDNGLILIDITTLINADFAAAAVLISLGAVLGVTTPCQLIVCCLIEIFLYAINEYIGTEIFQAIDVGGSMYIHAYGAYFGLALSRMLKTTKEITLTDEAATKTSDLFAMVGTVFLWIYWPSFNGAMASGDDQHRAVVNTLLSLTGSLIFTFIISALVSPDNKLSMVHIQNATLAGGVAVGAVADLMVKPFGALIIGSLAGALSTLGYVYITPFLQSKMNLHDTCGINNLHGMTGILGGLAGAVMAAIATVAEYGNSLYEQYPARAPRQNSSELAELQSDFSSIKAGDNRTATTQALYQLAALGVTLVIAIVGGSLTGLLLRAPVFGKVPNELHFDDSYLWEIPEDEERQKLVGEDGTHGVTNRTFDFEMSADKVNPNQEERM